eukprot:CAMPEP_0114401536 /NCGR_PEP_ID=MMETSP0102-20121206/17293_1 /TAXON_ID=38822 ORGANISM="Pteridomonas danica, Strain PT" /NCGR_SAMPLE_ID=MMETSP0102 /ASSEMBLY_ACC=CAM_ASM_000212 /LENGTH=291 /DNA_ID=CAMNT_0001564607 /DNA_START=39 /DNA_END=915 /DNA_ORIENTATION=+
MIEEVYLVCSKVATLVDYTRDFEATVEHIVRIKEMVAHAVDHIPPEDSKWILFLRQIYLNESLGSIQQVLRAFIYGAKPSAGPASVNSNQMSQQQYQLQQQHHLQQMQLQQNFYQQQQRHHSQLPKSIPQNSHHYPPSTLNSRSDIHNKPSQYVLDQGSWYQNRGSRSFQNGTKLNEPITEHALKLQNQRDEQLLKIEQLKQQQLKQNNSPSLTKNGPMNDSGSRGQQFQNVQHFNQNNIDRYGQFHVDEGDHQYHIGTSLPTKKQGFSNNNVGYPPQYVGALAKSGSNQV